MKKLFLTLAVALFAICSASAANYSVNDEAIDALVANATEVELTIDAAAAMPMAPAAPAAAFSQKNPWIATALCFFIGTLGIHRLYLGSKPLTCVIYILTFGGIFGVIPLVDFVVLILSACDDQIAPGFLGSSRFIAWM